MSAERVSIVLTGLSLTALGIVVGTLVAMSAQSLAQALLAALFALFGGSLLTLFEKLSVKSQIKVATGLLGISVGTLGGVYSGLYLNEHQLLTPRTLRVTANVDTTGRALDGPRKYLRENTLSDINAIDSQYRTGLMSAKDAYEQLYSAIAK